MRQYLLAVGAALLLLRSLVCACKSRDPAGQEQEICKEKGLIWQRLIWPAHASVHATL
jgi:hypothetical protein